MVFYVLLVALVNLGLGFALAFYHRCCEGLAPACMGRLAPVGHVPGRIIVRRLPAEPPRQYDPEPVATPSAELPPAPEPAEAPPTEGTPGRARAVLQLGSSVEHYHEQVAAIDEQIRDLALAPEPTGVANCLAALSETSQQFLEERDVAHQAFQAAYGADPADAEAQRTIDMAVAAQEAVLETTRAAAEAFDYTGDLAAGCRALREQTDQLLQTNRQLRDRLSETLAGAMVGDPDGVDRAASGPLPPAMLGRLELTQALAEWRAQDPQHARQLCVAAVDVDQLAAVNAEHGNRCGDEVLAAIGRSLERECRVEGSAARIEGTAFVFLLPDADLRNATNLVERVRQIIERTQFQYHGRELRVTISCAVTEAQPDDTWTPLLIRVQNTLKEAKRYGRNRTFLNEGQFPTPVVPPNFAIEPRALTL